MFTLFTHNKELKLPPIPQLEQIKVPHMENENTTAGFMMANFSTELVVMGARVALTTYNLPMVPGKMKNFDEFHKRFGKYIIAASGK